MSLAFIQAFEERHGQRRYKLWSTCNGRRHYHGMFTGLLSLASHMAIAESCYADGAVIEIQVVDMGDKT